MFSLIWKFLPAPPWLRVIVLLIAAVALVYAVITYVYPWVTVQFPPDDSTVVS